MLLRKPLTAQNLLPLKLEITVYLKGQGPRVMGLTPGEVVEVDDVSLLSSAVRVAATPAGYQCSAILEIPTAVGEQLLGSLQEASG